MSWSVRPSKYWGVERIDEGVRMSADPYEDHTNIHEPVDQICQLLDIDSTYVAELTIRPLTVTATLFRGKNGTCKGAKYIDRETGNAVMETLEFKTLS